MARGRRERERKGIKRKGVGMVRVRRRLGSR